jgi:hypothetical protein
MGMSTRVHVVMDDDLLRRVDEARGLVPRGAWIKAAVSAKLGDAPVDQVIEAIRKPSEPVREEVPVPRSRPLVRDPRLTTGRGVLEVKRRAEPESEPFYDDVRQEDF